METNMEDNKLRTGYDISCEFVPPSSETVGAFLLFRGISLDVELTLLYSILEDSPRFNKFFT